MRADVARWSRCDGLWRGGTASVSEDNFLKKCKITVVSLRQVAFVFNKAFGFRRVSNRVVGGRRQDLLQDSGVDVSSGVVLWCEVRRMLGSRMLQGRGTGGEGKRAGAAGGKRDAGLWL